MTTYKTDFPGSKEELRVEKSHAVKDGIFLSGSDVHLSPEKAREIAQFILDSTPEGPTPREQFDALPIGAEFAWDEPYLGKYWYVKVQPDAFYSPAMPDYDLPGRAVEIKDVHFDLGTITKVVTK
jgi:hypothetical protein